MKMSSIFDAITQCAFNLQGEMDKLLELVEKRCIESLSPYTYETYTIENFVDNYAFSRWKHRCRCCNTREMRARLGILTQRDILSSNRHTIMYLEYLGNILNLAIRTNPGLRRNQTIIFINETYQYILDGLNLESYNVDPEQIILIEKNEEAAAAAAVSSQTISAKILSYNHHGLKRNIQAKKSILLELAHDFEGYERTLSTYRSDLVRDTSLLLNNLNIRHNNCTPIEEGGKRGTYVPVVANMSPEEIEHWYDETYQLLLLCKLEHAHMTRKKAIEELKSQFKSA